MQSWRPKGETKGTLIVVHGLKDYSDRYSELAFAAVARGYAVHAFDLRGHGDSQGDRVWVDRFGDYVSDLSQFVARVQKDEPGKPLLLLGHSIGGAIVTLYTETEKPKLAGLITSAAALERDAPAGVVEHVSSHDKTHHAFPSLVHDLVHEPERAQVIKVIVAWLDAHTPAP